MSVVEELPQPRRVVGAGAARRSVSPSLVPMSAASCARVIVGDVSIDRYSGGIASNALFSRIREIRAARPSDGSTALAAAYASAALAQSPLLSRTSAVSASARASDGSRFDACWECTRAAALSPDLCSIAASSR